MLLGEVGVILNCRWRVVFGGGEDFPPEDPIYTIGYHSLGQRLFSF